MAETLLQDQRQQQQPASDPFDSLLNLEDQYHNEGYRLGLSDGERAGRAEGRSFGLSKGYEKFVEMGRLHGRAAVWETQLAKPLPAVSSGEGPKVEEGAHEKRLGTIGGADTSGRLRKHVQRLVTLTDPETLPTENSEEGVTEVDDRVKDAKAKATLIERIIGEGGASDRGGSLGLVEGANSRQQDERGAKAKKGPVRVKRGDGTQGAASSGSGGADVEDFIMPKHLQTQQSTQTGSGND